jgi:hypothetical protein
VAALIHDWGLESSGDFLANMPGAWVEMTQRVGSPEVVDQNTCMWSLLEAWTSLSIIAGF